MTITIETTAVTRPWVMGAVGWATLFGAGSCLVATGWDWPAHTVAPAIGDRILDGDPGIRTALLVTGAAKLVYAVALTTAWRRHLAPRLAAACAQLVAVGLVAWGVLE